MRSDDLSLLLQGDPNQNPSRFRQGEVIAWNISTGENTIRVNGGDLTDLPFLSPGGLFYLEPGEAVLVLQLGSSWMIVGKINTPGPDKAIGANTFSFDTFSSLLASNFALTTTYVNKQNFSVAVPTWMNRMVVVVHTNVFVTNTRAAQDSFKQRLLIDGQQAGEIFSTEVTGPGADISSTMVATSALTPGANVNFDLEVASFGGAWAATASNYCYIRGLIIGDSVDGD